jgi:Stage II sporulation protein
MLAILNENQVGRAFKAVSAAIFLFGALLIALLIGVPPTLAAAYGAAEVARGEEVTTLEPGASTSITIRFRNTGDATWTDLGKGYVSIYTYGPKYRKSPFYNSNWFSDVQPVRVMEPNVGPGNVTTFHFRVTAPHAEGTYKETFALASEDTAWIPGGEFTVTIVVRSAGAVVTQPVVAPSAPSAVAPAPTRVDPNAPPYRAELAAPLARLEMSPGSKQKVTLKFRNTGSVVWAARSPKFVSIYTYGPKYRDSLFRDVSWFGATQPAAITEATVEPGGTATVSFTLTAPAVVGDYSETFALAAESTAWIPGGQFVLPISVRASSGDSSGQSSGSSSGVTPLPDGTSGISSVLAPGYRAAKLLTSARDLTIPGGDTATFRVAFKNEGQKAWQSSGDAAIALMAESGNASSFRHTDWADALRAARLTSEVIQPGQLAFFEVTLAAPRDTGSYVPRFVLTADGAPIEGGSVEIPVQVTAGSASASIPSFGGAPDPSGPRGPNIRVGLFKTASPIVVNASGTYTLIDGRDHEPVRQLSGVTTVIFDDATLRYSVSNGSYAQTFDHHVHLRPDDPAATIFEIQSYSSIPTWDTSINFNKFRGELEVHYSSANGELWVIEELPMEDYMRGLAETSNGSPMEYQKALVTAARTFAYFVQKTGGKHASRHFDVTTGAGDQVYKGYVSELVRPNVVRAVEETRGTVVTYEGDVAVTPYFSRSDGRTRSYSEVWGKHNPWLVSKPAPYDEGKTLWGHGVGMSASDAVGRAESGATWQEILKYYYTGIELSQRY